MQHAAAPASSWALDSHFSGYSARAPALPRPPIHTTAIAIAAPGLQLPAVVAVTRTTRLSSPAKGDVMHDVDSKPQPSGRSGGLPPQLKRQLLQSVRVKAMLSYDCPAATMPVPLTRIR